MTVTFCSRMVGTSAVNHPAGGGQPDGQVPAPGFPDHPGERGVEGGLVKGRPVVPGAQEARHRRRWPAAAPGPHAWASTAVRSAALVRRSVTGPSGVVKAVQNPSGPDENDGSPVPRRSVPSVCCRLYGPSGCHRRDASAAAASRAGTSAMVMDSSSHGRLTIAGSASPGALRRLNRHAGTRLQVWRGASAPSLRASKGACNGWSGAFRDPRGRPGAGQQLLQKRLRLESTPCRGWTTPSPSPRPSDEADRQANRARRHQRRHVRRGGRPEDARSSRWTWRTSTPRWRQVESAGGSVAQAQGRRSRAWATTPTSRTPKATSWASGRRTCPARELRPPVARPARGESGNFVPMKYAQSILDLIGNTPLIKLNHVTDGIKATVLVKLEYLNPGGSIKDRIAAKMIEDAERDGKLLARRHHRGANLRQHRRGPGPRGPAKGLQVHLRGAGQGGRGQARRPSGLRRRGGGDAHRRRPGQPAELLQRLGPDRPETPGAYKPDQFSNPAAPGSHYETTGPEIWQDTDGRVTHCVIGAGTGGTITGTGRYLKEVSADRPESDGGRGQDHRRGPGRFGLLRRHRAARTSWRAWARTCGRRTTTSPCRTRSSPSATPTPSP